MTVVGIIQARMGSTRLPGKVMLPLDGDHVLNHVVRRAMQSSVLDKVVVATTSKKQDDILDRYATRAGAEVFRGDEQDVLGRMYGAAREQNADIVVRVTGDCPLVSPDCIDAVVETLESTDADYAANIVERTLPRGLDVEAFSFESFTCVESEAIKSHHREHVTPYYREREEQFGVQNIPASGIFDDDLLLERTDLRLTLDEADDYELLREVYENVSYDDILDIRDAVRYIDEHSLDELNANISQKSV